ncbi:hypothetical protein Hanom_Chr13g01197871 [Helianthus anomalus]
MPIFLSQCSSFESKIPDLHFSFKFFFLYINNPGLTTTTQPYLSGLTHTRKRHVDRVIHADNIHVHLKIDLLKGNSRTNDHGFD